MSPDQRTMFAVVAGIVVFVSMAAGLLWREARTRDTSAYVNKVIFGTPLHATPAHTVLTKLLRMLGDRFSRFYSRADLENLGSAVQAAGFNPHQVLPVLVGAKIVMMFLLPILAVIVAEFWIGSKNTRYIIIGGGVIAGILGPEMILKFIRKRFVAAVTRGTPDALDLLVLCSEAGMGLESALERVAQEMSHSNRAISSILFGLLNDLRVLPNQHDAFVNLGTRSGAEGLRRCGVMLSQSINYGTPLSDALRAVAGELRRERMNLLEEQAVKLPAKLIFPMVFFVMPSMYIVLLGVSLLRLYGAMSALMH
jgi:tight adherence protein C